MNDSQKEPTQPEPSPPSASPQAPSESPEVIEKVDGEQLRQFVTTIKSAEQQVGEHIISALRHDHTVAVLTTVVGGPGGQQVLSAALDPKMMAQVREVLRRAQQERVDEEPCVGFHCLVKQRDIFDDNSADDSDPPAGGSPGAPPQA